jgi:hypothetical protein
MSVTMISESPTTKATELQWVRGAVTMIRMADNESNIIAMSQWRSDDNIRIADNESNRIAMSQ